jgi:hypothetical protein
MATPLVQESVKKCDTISSLPNNGDDPARTNNVWSARDGAWMPPQRAPRFAKKVLGSREAVCSSMPGLKTMTRSDAVRDVPSSLCLTKSQCPCSAACLLIYDEHTCDSSRALTHAHAHAHLHMHTHTRARTHTHTRARTHTPHEAHTHTHTHAHTHTNTHPHTHTHAHTQTHTHTHTHTHIPCRWRCTRLSAVVVPHSSTDRAPFRTLCRPCPRSRTLQRNA